MTALAIIADDLTGALDTAAPFAMRGLKVRVALAPPALVEALADHPDIVAVSTASRDVGAEVARSRVSECVAALPKQIRIFKKVDSRLKGNLAAELDAFTYTRSLVCPAIPAFGRTVEGGKVIGFGIARPIDIAERLGRHAGRAEIPGAASQEDINAMLGVPADLLVGARGLAEAVARRMAPHGRAPFIAPVDSPALCIIGSTDPITLAQVDHLREARPGLVYVAAPGGIAPDLPLALAPLTLLQATVSVERADPETVARRLAAAVRKAEVGRIGSLVLTGGATAQAVLDVLGVRLLELVGEVLPGLPIARARAFTLVTKSGGFGERNTLLRLLGHLAA